MFINPKIKVIGDFKKENFYCGICQFPLMTLEDFDKRGKMDGDQKKQL